MKSMLIRIPIELHKSLKIKAATNGQTMESLVIEAIKKVAQP